MTTPTEVATIFKALEPIRVTDRARVSETIAPIFESFMKRKYTTRHAMAFLAAVAVAGNYSDNVYTTFVFLFRLRFEITRRVTTKHEAYISFGLNFLLANTQGEASKYREPEQNIIKAEVSMKSLFPRYNVDGPSRLTGSYWNYVTLFTRNASPHKRRLVTYSPNMRFNKVLPPLEAPVNLVEDLAEAPVEENVQPPPLEDVPPPLENVPPSASPEQPVPDLVLPVRSLPPSPELVQPRSSPVPTHQPVPVRSRDMILQQPRIPKKKGYKRKPCPGAPVKVKRRRTFDPAMAAMVTLRLGFE